MWWLRDSNGRGRGSLCCKRTVCGGCVGVVSAGRHGSREHVADLQSPTSPAAKISHAIRLDESLIISENVAIPTVWIHMLKWLGGGNCMRNCGVPRCPPSQKSHVIPRGPHSLIAQIPQNINELISKSETSSGELRATLMWTSFEARRRAGVVKSRGRALGARNVNGRGAGGPGCAARVRTSRLADASSSS